MRHWYGTKERGACCRYGYKGFYDRRHKPVVLTRKVVEGIQLAGGTILVRSWPCQPLALSVCTVSAEFAHDGSHCMPSGTRYRPFVSDSCARSSAA